MISRRWCRFILEPVGANFAICEGIGVPFDTRFMVWSIAKEPSLLIPHLGISNLIFHSIVVLGGFKMASKRRKRGSTTRGCLRRGASSLGGLFVLGSSHHGNNIFLKRGGRTMKPSLGSASNFI